MSSFPLFIHPVTLPLLSTSLNLFFSFAEHVTFSAFLSAAASEPKSTARVIKLWWRANYYPSLATILSLGVANLGGGIYALRNLPSWSAPAEAVMLGTAFAVSHFAFGPWIVPVIDGMCDDDEERRGKTVELMGRWLRIHWWRTALTDAPALGCFVWAVLKGT